jgi:hypothetical protein
MKTITFNINDCCVLQLISGGKIIAEFELKDLRVQAKPGSFSIRDTVSQFDFTNYTTTFSANDLRDARCNCITSPAILGCEDYIYCFSNPVNSQYLIM